MAVQNPFPINLLPKQDSWDKLQKLQHIDATMKYTAEEWNALLQAVNFLYENLTGGPGVGSINPSLRDIFFGSAAVDITQGTSTTLSELLSAINATGFNVATGEVVVLNAIVKRFIGQQEVLAEELYFFKRNNITGNWGTAPQGQNTNGDVTAPDLIFINRKILSNTLDAQAKVINLGNIGAQLIHQYINDIDPTTVPWENLLADGTKYYFLSVQNGANQNHLYVGDVPKTLGNGNDVVDANDFDLQGSSNSPAQSGDYLTTGGYTGTAQSLKEELEQQIANAGGGDMLANTYDPAGKAEQVLTIGDKATVNGLASLDGGGKVPSAQLPAYVDDVLEYDDLASFPASGETGKIYVAKDSNKNYRWSGSAYVVMNDLDSAAIKTLYEGNANTNAFTDAEKTKLGKFRPRAPVIVTGINANYNIDFAQSIEWDLTFVADVNVTFTNLVRDGEASSLFITGNIPNLPSYMTAMQGSALLDSNEVNHLAFNVRNAASGSEKIKFFNSYE